MYYLYKNNYAISIIELRTKLNLGVIAYAGVLAQLERYEVVSFLPVDDIDLVDARSRVAINEKGRQQFRDFMPRLREAGWSEELQDIS